MTAPDARRAAEENLIPALLHMARLHPLNTEHTDYWTARLSEARALLSAPQETPAPAALAPAVREAAEKVKRHYPLNDPDEPLTPFGEDVKALLSALDSNGGAK